MILNMVFAREWLTQKAKDDPQGRTNFEVMTEVRSSTPLSRQQLTLAQDYRRRIELTRPQTVMGTFSQMAAGLTHHVQPERLRRISRSIPKVLILTGDEDHLIRPANSVYIKAHMPEAEFVQWEKTGHGIHIQQKERFNALLERVFEEGRQRVREGFTPE